MKKPRKAAVARIDGDALIHLASAKVERASAFEPPVRSTLCGRKPARTVNGLPSTQKVRDRCPACYALVDAYGYPRV